MTIKEKLVAACFGGVAILALSASQAQAFLATATVTIVASAAGPFVIAFLILISANLIIFYKRIPKKFWFGLVVIISVALLAWLGGRAYKRYLDLKISNDLGTNLSSALEDDREWQEFVAEAQSSQEIDPQKKIVTQNGEYCVNRYSINISKLKGDQIAYVINNNRRKILDVSCPTITVKNGIKACGLSWELFTNYSDESAVINSLAEYDVHPGDEILLLCEFGLTTSHLAFILNHYGYDAIYGAITDIDQKLLDIPKDASFDDFTVLTDIFAYDKNDQYLYFFINDRDRDRFYPRTPRNFSEYLTSFTLVNASGLSINYPEDKEIAPLTKPASFVDGINVSDYKIVCKNKLHCFLTRHFLYYKDIKDFDTIYCISCKDEKQEKNYCDAKN